jgi:hypothetical protein
MRRATWRIAEAECARGGHWWSAGRLAKKDRRMAREESRKGIGRERVAELELGVVGVKERVVVRRSSKRREMIGCKTVINREKSGYVQGCAGRVCRLSGSLTQILCVCLVKLSAPSKAKPPRGWARLRRKDRTALIRSLPWAWKQRLLFSCERTQSVGPSIHPAYSIYSYSLFGQMKLPCIEFDRQWRIDQ